MQIIQDQHILRDEKYCF